MTVWRRNAPQLFFSFVAAGMTNVAAQEFFARAAPASKDRWLASTLFVGTLAADNPDARPVIEAVLSSKEYFNP